jgi:hypothetical protein
MLCHEISNIEQSVFVINLHPAHANGATFRRGGCLPWFREILDIARDNACQFMTLRGVYRVMNQCVNER